MSKGCCFLKQGEEFYIQFFISQVQSIASFLCSVLKKKDLNVLLVRLLLWGISYMANVHLKLSNDTNFMKLLKILVQGKMQRS